MCRPWSTSRVTHDNRHVEAESATARAVRSERQAIERHEAVARRLDQMAADMDQHAHRESDKNVKHRVGASAARARARAEAARGRAEAARKRLREEGFDPD